MELESINPLANGTSFTLTAPLGSGLQGSNTSQRWCYDADSTTSSGTGPTGPHAGTYYWYCETSGTSLGANFIMEMIDTLDASTYNYQIDFWYSNYGTGGGGQCLVQYWNGATWITEQTIGWDTSSAAWKAATQIDLSGYSNSDGKMRWNFTTGGGTTYQNDFALDDMTITAEVASSSSSSLSSSSLSSSSLSSSSLSSSSSSSSLSSSSLSSSSSSLSSSSTSSSSSSTAQEPYWWGTGDTPTAKAYTAGSNYTTIGKDAGGVVPEGGYVTQIEIYTTGAGTMDFAAFDGSGAGTAGYYTDTKWIQGVSVANGYNQLIENIDYPAPFAVSAGQWLGFWNGDTDVYADSGENALYDSGDQIGDGNQSYFSAESNRDYQVRYYIELTYSSSSSSVSSSSVSSSSTSVSSSSESLFPYWWGTASQPADGPGGIGGGYTIIGTDAGGAVPKGGYVTQIELFTAGTSTMDFAAFDGPSAGGPQSGYYTDTNWVQNIPITSTGLNQLSENIDYPAPFTVSAGQYLGVFNGTTTIRSPYSGSGQIYDYGDHIGDGNQSFFQIDGNRDTQIRFFIQRDFSLSSSSLSSSSSSESSSSTSSSSSSESSSSISSSSQSADILHDGLHFNTSSIGGAGTWFAQSSTVQSGVTALQSGPVSGSQQSRLDLVNPGVSGTLLFYWKVSSGVFDPLNLFLNDGYIDGIAGEVDWVQKSYDIQPGDNWYWKYSTPGAVNAGEDTGWIDTIEISLASSSSSSVSSSSVSSSSSSTSSSSTSSSSSSVSSSSSSLSISSSSLSSSSTSSSSLSSSSSSTSFSSSSSSTSSSSESSSFSLNSNEGYWYGKNGVPTTALSQHLANHTYVPLADVPDYQQPNPSAGYIDLIQFYLYSAGTLKFSTFTKSGNDFRDDDYVTLPTYSGSSPIGLIIARAGIDFNASDLPISAGQYVGFYGDTARIYSEIFGEAGVYNDGSDQIGDHSFSTFTLNAANGSETRVHVTYSLSSSQSSSSTSSSSESSSSESSSSSSLSSSSSSSSLSSSSLSSSSESSSSESSSSSSTSSSSTSSSSTSSSSSSYAIPGFWWGAPKEPSSTVNTSTYTDATYSQRGDDPPTGFPSGGYITKIETFVTSAGSFQFAVFSKSGSDFTDEHWIPSGALSTGLQTLVASAGAYDSRDLPVVAGEYAGFYSPLGTISRGTVSGAGFDFRQYNQIGNGTPIGFYGVDDETLQLRFFIEVDAQFSSSSTSSSSLSSSSSSLSSSSSSISSSSSASGSSSSSSTSSSSESFSSSSVSSSSSTSSSSTSLVIPSLKHFWYTLRDDEGVPRGGEEVYVYEAGTTNPVNLYNRNGLPITNPVTTSTGSSATSGVFEFFIKDLMWNNESPSGYAWNDRIKLQWQHVDGSTKYTDRIMTWGDYYPVYRIDGLVTSREAAFDPLDFSLITPPVSSDDDYEDKNKAISDSFACKIYHHLLSVLDDDL